MAHTSLWSRTAAALGLGNLPEGGGVLFAAFVLSNISGYVFYVVMSRLLDPERYGALGAVVAAFSILAVPAAAIQTVVARRAAVLNREGQSGDVAALLRVTARASIAVAIGGAVVVLALAPTVSSYLHLRSLPAAALIAAYVLVAFATPAPRGILLGLSRFHVLALALGLIAVLRVALGVGFVSGGLGIAGAIAGFVLAEFASLGVMAPPVAKLMRGAPTTTFARGILAEITLAFVALGGLAAVTNIDVVLVRHYFPHEASGFYSAAAVVGRGVFFVAISLPMLVFPRIAEDGARGAESRSAMRWGLLATTALSISACVFVLVAGRPLMREVFGPRYGSAATVALVSAVSSGLYSLSALILYFQIAAKSRASLAVLPAVALESAAIVLFHNTILEVAWVTVVVSAILLAVSVVLIPGRRTATAR